MLLADGVPALARKDVGSVTRTGTGADVFATTGAHAFAATSPGTRWELQTFLELGALPTAVSCARLHTRHVLWEWHLSALADAAEIIVSELMTNAIAASGGLTCSRFAGRWAPGVPPVRLWLSSDRQRIAIQVWDASDKLPTPQHPEPDAETGRGLMLVESLSGQWGSYTPERSSGKVVWALVEEQPG